MTSATIQNRLLLSQCVTPRYPFPMPDILTIPSGIESGIFALRSNRFTDCSLPTSNIKRKWNKCFILNFSFRLIFRFRLLSLHYLCVHSIFGVMQELMLSQILRIWLSAYYSAVFRSIFTYEMTHMLQRYCRIR